MKKHIDSVHEGKKPFMCEFCGYGCLLKSSMNRHVASVHDGNKPFRCEFCDYSCAVKSNMNKHIASIHPSELKEDTEMINEIEKPCKKYFCYVCEKDTWFGKVDHIEKFHSEKDGNLTCPKCEKIFAKFDLCWFTFIV